MLSNQYIELETMAHFSKVRWFMGCNEDVVCDERKKTHGCFQQS